MRIDHQYTTARFKERFAASCRRTRPGRLDDIIVSFCGERTAVPGHSGRTGEIRFDTVFAAAYSTRPGTPAERLADDVPSDVKRRRLNELLARQERIGLELNQEWLGRSVEVLVERIAPPRGAAAAANAAPTAAAGEGSVALVGHSRHNKLVHLAGSPELVGQFVTVQVDHAGPFALRGQIAGDGATTIATATQTAAATSAATTPIAGAE